MSSRRIKLFRGAMEMNIPDGLELDVSRPMFDSMERDTPQIVDTWKIRKRRKKAAWNRKGSICFRDLDNFDTFINCTISEEEGYSQVSESLLKAVVKAQQRLYPSMHDVKSHITHDSNDHVIGAISSVLDTESGHWCNLGLLIPIENRIATINMNCTDSDAPVRWKQFLQAADSIEIFEPDQAPATYYEAADKGQAATPKLLESIQSIAENRLQNVRQALQRSQTIPTHYRTTTLFSGAISLKIPSTFVPANASEIRRFPLYNDEAHLLFTCWNDPGTHIEAMSLERTWDEAKLRERLNHYAGVLRRTKPAFNLLTMASYQAADGAHGICKYTYATIDREWYSELAIFPVYGKVGMLFMTCAKVNAETQTRNFQRIFESISVNHQ